MSYFTAEFHSFLKGLSENNNREWFEDHKPTYLKEVKEPFKALVGDVIDRMRSHEPRIQMTPNQAVFRIYRDVRFSKDKSPYKPHASAFVCSDSKKSGNPGFYFQLSHRELFVGGGKWSLDKETLHKIRTEIVYSPEEFQNIVTDKNFTKTYGELKGDKNKILPKEFREDAEKQPLLFHKQYLFQRSMNAKVILKDNLLDTLLEHYITGKPLIDFLQRALDD